MFISNGEKGSLLNGENGEKGIKVLTKANFPFVNAFVLPKKPPIFLFNKENAYKL